MSETNSNHQTITQELSATANLSSDQQVIEEITAKILQHKGQVVQSFLEIGNLLIEAKKHLTKHGHWLAWLSTSVDISERMAQRYMQLATAFSNPTSVSDLGMTKALALLALPEAKRETFIGESHEVNGEQKKVSEMSTRELKKAIRAQNEADQSFTIKKVYRDKFDTSHNHEEEDSKTPSRPSNLDGLNTDLASAQKHLNCILAILGGGQVEIPALQDKVTDGLRSLHKTVLECLSLANVEPADGLDGADHA